MANKLKNLTLPIHVINGHRSKTVFHLEEISQNVFKVYFSGKYFNGDKVFIGSLNICRTPFKYFPLKSSTNLYIIKLIEVFENFTKGMTQFELTRLKIPERNEKILNPPLSFTREDKIMILMRKNAYLQDQVDKFKIQVASLEKRLKRNKMG